MPRLAEKDDAPKLHVLHITMTTHLSTFLELRHRLCDDRVDGWAQDCSNSIARAMELLQSCAMRSVWLTQGQWGYRDWLVYNWQLPEAKTVCWKLLSLMAPEIVIMTTAGATSDDKVDTMTTLDFQNTVLDALYIEPHNINYKTFNMTGPFLGCSTVCLNVWFGATSVSANMIAGNYFHLVWL